MSDIKPSVTSDDVRVVYGAIVDYHNNLVQMRFTVVGLFLAANGFLASGYFQPNISALHRFFLALLCLGLTIICWGLEVRTYQLMENLAARGTELEKSFDLNKDKGFFALMANQPIGPRLMPTHFRLPAYNVKKNPFSHSNMIGLLYVVIGLFWLIMLIMIFVRVL